MIPRLSPYLPTAQDAFGFLAMAAFIITAWVIVP